MTKRSHQGQRPGDVPHFPRGKATLDPLPSLQQPMYVIGQPRPPEPPPTSSVLPEEVPPRPAQSAHARLVEIFGREIGHGC